jgi:recombination protein RecR
MSDIDKLAELFSQFPGIGPRQARRFAYFLLRQSDAYKNTLIAQIRDLKNTVCQCSECFRYAERKGKDTACAICSDPARDKTLLMIVEKDTDVDAMEKSGAYIGQYFVLGGTLGPSANGKRVIRESELAAHVGKHAKDLKEIILALSATVDGEYTTEHTMDKLRPLTKAADIAITVLGRGLSTGSELEYADPATLQSALKNRA